MISRPRPRRMGRDVVRPAEAREDSLGAYILERTEKADVPTAVRRLDAGGSVYESGDEDRYLFIVVSGLVRVYKTYGAFREATVGLAGEGGVFGEPALQADGLHRDSAVALTSCRIAQVPKAALGRHFERDPGCALALLGVFGEWAERREGMISRLVPREVRSRLAAVLLELADEFGVETRRGDIALRVRLTHQQLADLIACTREAVSKEVSSLRRDGLIELRGRPRRIVLRDRPALVEAARERGRRRAAA